MKLQSTLFIICIFILFVSGFSQNYVDLAKVSHTQIPNAGFENSDALSTPITQSKILTSIPIKISDSLAFLTGVDYELHNLKLFPISDPVNLSVITAKLGFNFQHNSRLSATYLLLPKLATDFGHLKSSFQIGAITLFKYKLNDQTKLVFGDYVNKEFFGILNVPILGVYHKSKNKKTEIDIKFPIIGYGDYKIHKNLRIGADFLMIVRTFDLAKTDVNDFYVHAASNEVAAYLQFDLFKESLVIKAKAVYSMFDYGVYGDNDGTPFGMLGWYPGDERIRLNSEYEGTLGFKVSAIYRFQLD